MTLDLARARADTPGVNHIAHLNNAGASLSPKPVIDAVVGHVRLESELGPYEAAERAQAAIDRAHAAVGALLNCDSQEVALFDSASRAWGMALASIPLRAGDRVLVSPMEYGSSYLSLIHLARRAGVRVEVLPVDSDGLVPVAELRDRLDERVKLIAMTHVPTHDGLVYPVASIGQVARENGIPFLVDACQSVGQLPVDVAEIGCDMLVGAGRKYLRGPRGTGFMFVRRQLAERLSPAMVGLDGVEWSAEGYRFAPAARRFDTWETNCAARIGLGVAIDYALSWGVEHTWPRIRQLAADLRAELGGIAGVTVHDRGQERCGTVAITVAGWDTASVRAELHRAGINTWVCLANAACVDMRVRGLENLLRISVHYYNSAEELARLCSVLESLTAGQRLRAVS
jgi:cysteine desulfurase / selenocysteine lyase